MNISAPVTCHTGMKIIAQTTYPGCEDYPSYTLALIPVLLASDPSMTLMIPAIICAYAPDSCRVYAYEDQELARKTFLSLSVADPSTVPEDILAAANDTSSVPLC
jgi:hypothetical protein